jgi:hypothetical protein
MVEMNFNECSPQPTQSADGAFKVPINLKPPALGTFLDIPYNRNKIINVLIYRIDHNMEMDHSEFWVCEYKSNGAPKLKPKGWKFTL